MPVLNEDAHLWASARTMREQRFSGDVELLLIDGGSTDATRAILQRLTAEDPRVRLLDNPGRTTPKALNIGLRHARGSYVVRMDAHSRYPADYIAKGVERLERGDVEFVSGAAVPYGVDGGSRRTALALSSRIGTGGSAFRRAHKGEIEVDSGPFGVWRRATLEALGGWDEGWPVNQDAELAARIRADGGKLVCIPELNADYMPRSRLRALSRQYRRFGFYRAKTTRRHPESIRAAHALPPALVSCLAVSVAGPRWVRPALRPLLAAYVVCLLAESVRLALPGRVRDAALLPLVFATMHLSWGAGFLAGCVRFGLPVDELARRLRR